ncbi:MAG: hypothetical protein DDT19_02746 [Syntrophomonadaceae bacterium]|nr:hypothetical protein [Bacillota bacterium]
MFGEDSVERLTMYFLKTKNRYFAERNISLGEDRIRWILRGHSVGFRYSVQPALQVIKSLGGLILQIYPKE